MTEQWITSLIIRATKGGGGTHFYIDIGNLFSPPPCMLIIMFPIMLYNIPQIEYPLGGSSKKGSHVYFLLIVCMVLLLWHQIVLLWHQVTMVASEQHLYQTIILLLHSMSLTQKTCNRKYKWLPFLLLPLVGILFEVLIIALHWINIGVLLSALSSVNLCRLIHISHINTSLEWYIKQRLVHIYLRKGWVCAVALAVAQPNRLHSPTLLPACCLTQIHSSSCIGDTRLFCINLTNGVTWSLKIVCITK